MQVTATSHNDHAGCILFIQVLLAGVLGVVSGRRPESCPVRLVVVPSDPKY